MPLMLSHASATQHELLDLVAPHYIQFAQARGWDILLDKSDETFADRGPHWHKVRLIKDLLARNDFLIWVDCDFVLRSEANPLDELRDEDFQGLVMQNDAGGPAPNTGLWLLRNCDRAHRFIERVWEVGQLPDATLNDQATVSHLLGFSYEPAQCKPMRGSEFLAQTGWLDRHWNMLYSNSPEAALVGRGIHYGGAHTMPLEHKLTAISTQLRRDGLAGWEPLLPLAAELNDGPPLRHPSA